MKLISWNVNGIRAVVRKEKLQEILADNPDIVCIQETKATAEQLTGSTRNPQGYYSYFNSPEEKKGYAGTAVYSKMEAKEAVYGLPTKPELDTHGRLITLYFDDFVLVNGYLPNGKSKSAPLDYKLEFFDEFLSYINGLKQDYSVVVTGDFNVAHTEIDLARPDDNEDSVGFLSEEREWVDRVCESGWIDVFRHLYPNKTDSYTYWNLRTRARDRNVGWRIDYFFVSPDMAGDIKDIRHMTEVYGSDHCPLLLELQ